MRTSFCAFCMLLNKTASCKIENPVLKVTTNESMVKGWASVSVQWVLNYALCLHKEAGWVRGWVSGIVQWVLNIMPCAFISKGFLEARIVKTPNVKFEVAASMEAFWSETHRNRPMSILTRSPYFTREKRSIST